MSISAEVMTDDERMARREEYAQQVAPVAEEVIAEDSSLRDQLDPLTPQQAMIFRRLCTDYASVIQYGRTTKERSYRPNLGMADSVTLPDPLKERYIDSLRENGFAGTSTILSKVVNIANEINRRGLKAA